MAIVNSIQGVTFTQKRFISKQVFDVEAISLPEAMSDLCMLHFNLRALRITGILMKESAPSSTSSNAANASRAIYDVIILSPSGNHLFPG